MGFYCDSKNSSIITEKPLLISSKGDWKCFLKSQFLTILTTSYFAKWSLSLCRKSRVLANGPSLPFGDVVYGCPPTWYSSTYVFKKSMVLSCLWLIKILAILLFYLFSFFFLKNQIIKYWNIYDLLFVIVRLWLQCSIVFHSIC